MICVSSKQNSPDRNRENDVDEDQNYSGYNSGDEHNGQKYDLTPEQWEERDKLFIKTMSDRGFVIEQIVEDGACLFRSISLQIYGDQNMHEMIRQQTMDYIVSLHKMKIKSQQEFPHLSGFPTMFANLFLFCSVKIVNILCNL